MILVCNPYRMHTEFSLHLDCARMPALHLERTDEHENWFIQGLCIKYMFFYNRCTSSIQESVSSLAETHMLSTANAALKTEINLKNFFYKHTSFQEEIINIAREKRDSNQSSSFQIICHILNHIIRILLKPVVTRYVKHFIYIFQWKLCFNAR